MKITKDSPLLTNYLLGEVTEAERIAVETAAQNDPEIKAALQNLKPAINLTKTLGSQSVNNSLTPAQREKVFAVAGLKSTGEGNSKFSWATISGGLIAASLAVVLFLNNRNHFDPMMKGSESHTADMMMNESGEIESADRKKQQYANAGISSSRGQSAKIAAPAESKKIESDMASNSIATKAEELNRNETKMPVAGAAKDSAAPSEVAQSALEDSAAPVAAADSAAMAAPSSRSAGFAAKPTTPPEAKGTSSAARRDESLDFAPPSKMFASGGAGASSEGSLGRAPEKRKSISQAQDVVSGIPENIILEVSGPADLIDSKLAQQNFYKLVESCFSGSLSRYSKYDEEWNFSWTSANEKIIHVSYAVVKSNSQNFDSNLRCVQSSIRSSSPATLPRTETVQKWRLILKSK